jgi:hypothetical protein
MQVKDKVCVVTGAASGGLLANIGGDREAVDVACDIGRVDIFFSSAGLSRRGQERASDTDWDVSASARILHDAVNLKCPQFGR